MTPVMIVPGSYSASELRMLAENIVTQVVNNGSFNCNAAKILVLSESWPQREELLKTVQDLPGHTDAACLLSRANEALCQADGRQDGDAAGRRWKGRCRGR